MNAPRLLTLLAAWALAASALAQTAANEEAKKFGRQITGTEPLQEANDKLNSAISAGQERARKFMRIETDQERWTREANEERNRRLSGEVPPKTEAELQKEREEAHQRDVRAAERASDERRATMESDLKRFSKAQWDCRNAANWAHSQEEVREQCKAYADMYKECTSPSWKGSFNCERARKNLNFLTPAELEQQALEETSKRVPPQPKKGMAVPDNVPAASQTATSQSNYLQAEREARQRESEQVRQQVLSGTAPVAPANAFRQADPNAQRRAEDQAARRRQEESSRWKQANDQQRQQAQQPVEQPSSSSGNTAAVLNVLGAVAVGAIAVEANRRQAAAPTGGGMASGGITAPASTGSSGSVCTGPRKPGDVCRVN